MDDDATRTTAGVLVGLLLTDARRWGDVSSRKSSGQGTRRSTSKRSAMKTMLAGGACPTSLPSDVPVGAAGVEAS
jgi:hypothetical protein